MGELGEVGSVPIKLFPSLPDVLGEFVKVAASWHLGYDGLKPGPQIFDGVEITALADPVQDADVTP